MPEQLRPSISSPALDEEYKIDEPEVEPYSEWAAANATEDDEVQNRVNYSNAVREKYIKHGSYDDPESARAVESDLQNGLVSSLEEDLGFDRSDPEALASLSRPPERSLDDKLSLIKAHFKSDSEEWNIVTRQQAHQKALQNSGDDGMSNPFIAERTEKYLQEATELASGDAYQKALRMAVDKGELSMAILKTNEGEDYIHSGKLLDELSFGDAMKQAVSLGNMSYANSITARGLYDKQAGSTLPQHQYQRYNEVGNMMEALASEDSNFAFQMQRLEEMQATYEDAGGDTEEERAKKIDLRVSQMYATMSELFEEGAEPDYEDFLAVATTKAQTNNFYKQELYEEDSEDVGKNLRRIGHLPPQMSQVAMAHKGTFEATLKANPSLSEEEVTMLREQRDRERVAQFGARNKFLKESRVGEEWTDALTKGRANGEEDADIFDAFVEDPDNYSAFSTVARGLGASVEEGLTDVAGFIAMTAGADWGREMLLDNAKDKAKRVEFQEMFGDKHGFWQQSGEMIAPVLVDMTATTLLAGATLPAGGVGGAAYLAAKTGARLSVKGVVKNMTKSVLRQQAGEQPEEAAKRLLTLNLIKGSSEAVKKKGAMEAIRGYNELLAVKMGAKDIAIAVPAYNRSAGGTYASVYQKLGDDKSLSHEERHDKAMGAAMAAGAVTALITTGFSRLGLGGIDDALIKGATKKQLMGILSPIVNRGGAEMAEGTFNGVMKTVMNETIKKYGTGSFIKGMARGAAEEFPEEALDEFVNTFIEDTATGDDTPLIDRLQQSLMAGLQGAVMGAGVPAAQTVAGSFTAKQRINEMGGQIQNQFYNDVSAKLAETSSPLTARAVQDLALQPARRMQAVTGRATSAVQQLKQERAAVEEQTKAEKKELAQRAGATLSQDVIINDKTIPKGTPLSKSATAKKIDDANLAEKQMQLDLEEQPAPEPKPVAKPKNTDNSRSSTGSDSTVDEIETEALTDAEFSEELDAPANEVQDFKDYVSNIEEEVEGEPADPYKPRDEWEQLWSEFQDTVVRPEPEQVEGVAEPTPLSEEQVQGATKVIADKQAEIVKVRQAIEATPDEGSKAVLEEQLTEAEQELDVLESSISEQPNAPLELDTRFSFVDQTITPNTVSPAVRVDVNTETGVEQHRVIASEPVAYAIEEIHEDLFNIGDIVGDGAMVPSELTPAIEAESARLVLMSTPDNQLYYMSGLKELPLGAGTRIPKLSAEEIVANYDGANAQDPSVIVYPSESVTEATVNDSMVDVTDANSLRALEQEANNRLLADPFDRGAAIQKSYLQTRLKEEGEETVDQVNANTARANIAQEEVTRSLKAISEAAESEAQPRRQVEAGAVIRPEAYLEVTQDQQLDELSDEALASIIPQEQISPSRIPAITQGQADSVEDLQQRQIERVRNIIFTGYPVGINPRSMYGILKQSQAAEGGYISMLEDGSGQQPTSYHKYFRQQVAEKIDSIWPKIDLRNYAGQEVGVDSAYKADDSSGVFRKKSANRAATYQKNEDGTVTLLDLKETRYYVNADGVGVFNNDPVEIGEMLINGVPIRIPKAVLQNNGSDTNILSRSQINPSLRYDKVTGEIFRVVRPASDGVGVETIERASRLGEILPDTGYSDKTYEVNNMLDNTGLGQVAVANATMASDTGTTATEHYVILNDTKEKQSIRDLQTGFDQFSSSALRGLSRIKSDQQKEYDALEDDMNGVEGNERAALDANAKRAGYHMSEILGLGEAAGIKQLNDTEASEAIAAFVSEYKLAINTHGIRTELVNNGHVDTEENIIKPSREVRAIEKFEELSGNRDTETLVTRLGDRMGLAKEAYSFTTEAYQKLDEDQQKSRNDAVILAYLNEQVVGSPWFNKGQMPTMSTVAKRARDRMLGQRKKQGSAFFTSSTTSLDEMTDEGANVLIENNTIDPDRIPESIAVAQNEPEFADATDTSNLPKGVSNEVFTQIQQTMLEDIISESNEAAINTIKTDEVARGAFIDMLRRTTHFGQNRADYFYDKMNVEAEWGAVVGAMQHATINHSPEVLTFIKGLRQGTLSSGLDMRSALKYVLFPQNVSNSFAQQMQPYLVSLNVGIGPDPSFLPQVKTILNASSKVLRKRYAMAATTEADRPNVVARNTAEAEALGLVDGDSASVVAALQNILENSSNENHQLVADLLLEDTTFIESVEFRMSENTTLVPAEYTKNADGSHSVSINLGGANGRGLENVLLEEYIHAFLSDVVARPASSLKPNQRTSISRLTGLMTMAKAEFEKSGRVDTSISYAFSNMDEFVAGLLLNPEFQSYIKSIETPAQQRGLFTRIAEAIANLFRRAAGGKITKEETIAYTDAIKDVIDLAQSESSTGRTNLVLSVSAAINEQSQIDKSKGLEKYGMDGSENLSLSPDDVAFMQADQDRAAKRAANTRRAQRDTQDMEYPKAADASDLTTQEMVDFVSYEIIPFIRSFTPPELRLKVDKELKGAMGQAGNVVYLNPAKIAQLIGSISGDGVNNRDSINLAILSILDEEVGHYASFNQLTQKEIDDMGDRLGVNMLAGVAQKYFSNPTDAQESISRLNSTDSDVALQEKRNMVEEHLRMQLQRATRGFTSEEDTAFYQTNPSLLKTLFRYFQGYMKAVAFRYSIRKEKPMAPINRLIAEMRQVKAGYRAGSNMQLFDANNPTANLELLNAMLKEPIVAEVEAAMGLATIEQAVDAGFGIQGSSVGLDERMFGERSIEFDHIPQMFEVPFMKAGEYKAPSNWFVKNLSGDADPRLVRFGDILEGNLNEGVRTLKMFDNKFRKLLKDAYGDGSLEYPNKLIGKAIGTNANVELDADVIKELNDERTALLTEVFANPALDAAGRDAARQEVYDYMDAKRDDLLRSQADALRVEQENALNEIRVQSPELAKYIGIMRTDLIDELSKVLIDKYGLENTPLGIRVDNQLGLYITRTYKMFTEAGYHEKLRESVVNETGDYEVVRTEAIAFFEKQFIESQTKLNIDARGMDPKTAEDTAKQSLVNNPTFGHDALVEFIDSYENPSVKTAINNSDGYRVIMDNLKERKGDDSFPSELRAVLGENTNEEAGLTNLLLTYGTVMNMVANQTFLYNIAAVGRAENVVNAQPEDKFLMTYAERQEAMKTDHDKYSKWVTAKDRSSRNDPLAGLYAPPEMWEHLKVMTDKQMKNEMISTAEQTARTAGVIAAKATGVVMGIKTLGSVGFYLRNVMSNMLYFGPSQGFYNMPKMLKSAAKHLTQTLVDPEAVDAKLSEYTGLLIIGDNMNTRLLGDLMRGHVEVDSIKKEMRELEATVGPIDKLDKAKGAGMAIIKKLTDMADAVDSFYKIAYFENELRVIEEAVEAAPAGTSFASMKGNPRQMKMEAARKVLKTAQYSSQRVAFAKEASTNAFGLLFAPYLGFTSDVFRIPVNTAKLGWEELTSDNPVIQKRGKQRLAGLSIVMGGLSVALPAAFSGILGGLDDEEQNALRESLPEYLRSHSMFYWKWNGNLHSTDLTYVNPFAMLVDPFVRSIEKIMMGDYREAAAAMTVDFLGDSFLSDQILAGVVWDLKGNRDSSTGEQIYDGNADSIGDITSKTLGYFYKKAAEPNTFLKVRESIERAGLDTENFNDSSMGQLASMFYPAKVHTIDLDRSFRRMLFSEKQSAINSKSQLFEVYQAKPMTSEAVADIYFDHYDRQTRLDSRMYRFLRAYEGMGMSRAHMRHTLVKFGYGKRRADNILSGISEAPSLSPKMMSSLGERGLLDRAGPLYQAATEVPRWRLLDPR
jgi:ribosomal 50S subunit-recycling heat shock protein